MQKKIPMRMCIACRQMKDKSQLIRIVKHESGNIAVDLTSKANGRGCYLCKDLACVDKAVKSNALNRAFKCQVDNKIIESVREILQK